MSKFFRLLFPLVAVFSLTVCSCNNGKQGGDDNGNTEPEKPENYKFVASALKGAWQAGDEIFVHGALGSSAQTIKLTSADISEDGKTATLSLDEGLFDYPAEPDGLYAVWPAEAVKFSFGVLKTKTTFKQCDILLTMAYLDNDTFAFTDASSALSFTVSGDYDKYAIAATGREGLTVTRFEGEYTSEKKVFNQLQNDGYPFIYGAVRSGEEVLLWFPGDMTFNGGLTVYLGKGETWPASYSASTKTLKIPAGECKDLGDLGTKATAYNGPAPKMPVMGKRTEYDVEFNELSGICLSSDGTFLWGMGDDGSIARLSLEGEVLEEHWIGCDLEAVTIDPRNGDLIVGIEDLYNPKGSGEETYSYNGVGRIAAPDYKVPEGLFRIAAAKSYGNAGIEGVTYYKNGTIYAGAQASSHLFLCDLATGEVLDNVKLREKFPAITEIADLCYDPLTDWLWIIDSESRMFFALTGDAKSMLGAYYTGQIDNPEAIYVDHQHSCIWVADDAGDPSHLYRFDFTGLDDAIIQ